jgi:hypothetical protein
MMEPWDPRNGDGGGDGGPNTPSPLCRVLLWLASVAALAIANKLADAVRVGVERLASKCWHLGVEFLQESGVSLVDLAFIVANIAACSFLWRWFLVRARAPGFAIWALLGAAYHALFLASVIVNHTTVLTGYWAVLCDATYATMSLILLDNIVHDRQARRVAAGLWGATLGAGAVIASLNQSWHLFSDAVSIVGALSVFTLCLRAPLPGPARLLILLYPICLSLRPVALYYNDALLSHLHLAGLVCKILLVTTSDMTKWVPATSSTSSGSGGQNNLRFWPRTAPALGRR